MAETLPAIPVCFCWMKQGTTEYAFRGIRVPTTVPALPAVGSRFRVSPPKAERHEPYGRFDMQANLMVCTVRAVDWEDNPNSPYGANDWVITIFLDVDPRLLKVQGE